jgi:general secretion pathway protein K
MSGGARPLPRPNGLRARPLLRNQRGIALLAVLWVVIVLGLMAAVFMRESRIEVNLTRNLIEEAKAEAMADAGISRAMLGLVATDDAAFWRPDGTPYDFAFADGFVRVTLQDESGKIDLNRSAGPVLQALFEAAGLAPPEAQQLLDAMADYRDADHLRHVNGAEDPDYAAAGLAYDAKDAPFAMTEELLQVPGMTRELFDRVAPYITVYSPRRDVNIATASPDVLRLLPYLTPARVDALLKQRADQGRGGRRWRVVAVTVVADATTANGGRFIREAVLRRSSDRSTPFDVVQWRRRWPSDLGGQSEAPRPADQNR